VLHRCLEKDPRKRRRDMGDVVLDLDLPLPVGEVAAPPARRVKVAWMTAVAVTGLALMAIAYTAYFQVSRSPFRRARDARRDQYAFHIGRNFIRNLARWTAPCVCRYRG